MRTSQNWISYFKQNLEHKRIDWQLKPAITAQEVKVILSALQAWQLGETSEGTNLIHAATKYADSIGDPDYVDAIRLFIKEEQRHGSNLGLYLDAIGQPRIKKNWGDSLFRKVRHFNTSMEMWTLAVIVVESTAQIFYQALKEATQCKLLKQICTDILIDEATHITFQTERLAIIVDSKTMLGKDLRGIFYRGFFLGTSVLIWLAHKKLFKAGGNTFKGYMRKMEFKYLRTISRVTADHPATRFIENVAG